MTYPEFLEQKMQLSGMYGFKPTFLPDILFDFQKYLIDWNINKGRSATFSDTGTGKTIMELVWAQNVVEHTNGNVLIGAPLAVSHQTVKEGEKFGIEIKRSNNGKPAGKITITNYEKLHLFNPADYVGFICDESGILKNFDGVTKQNIIEFMKKLPYRALFTATAAPNDYPELGNSSEALGEMGYMDMLNKYFINDQHVIKPMKFHRKGLNFAMLQESGKMRFKKHAVIPYWKWVSSWARAMRMPSDLGFSDEGFILPKLTETQHVIENSRLFPGELFVREAIGRSEQLQEARQTLQQRCDKAAQLVNDNQVAVIWCNLNPEGDYLEKIIPDAVQVHGRFSDEKKEEILQAFAKGEIRVLITKPKISCFGLNWQHCAHTVFFPTHSFEQYYQSIRRFWRYGQKNPVQVDIVSTTGGMSVLKNLQRKAKQADQIFTEIVKYMNDSIRISNQKEFTQKTEIPQWL
jgi:hypothetical protein